MTDRPISQGLSGIVLGVSHMHLGGAQHGLINIAWWVLQGLWNVCLPYRLSGVCIHGKTGQLLWCSTPSSHPGYLLPSAVQWCQVGGGNW